MAQHQALQGAGNACLQFLRRDLRMGLSRYLSGSVLWGRDVIPVEPGVSAIGVGRCHRSSGRVKYPAGKWRSRDARSRCPAPARAAVETLLDAVKEITVNDGVVQTGIGGFAMDDLSQIGPVAQEMKQRTAAEGLATAALAGPGHMDFGANAFGLKLLSKAVDGPQLKIASEDMAAYSEVDWTKKIKKPQQPSQIRELKA